MRVLLKSTSHEFWIVVDAVDEFAKDTKVS
jgi:hypothetical protein